MPKPINWAAIKKRYLLGDKPKAIATDYGLTAKQVSEKAYAEDWKEKKQEISEKVVKKAEEQSLSELDEIVSIYGPLIKDTGRKLAAAREAGLIGLTIQDGEGYSSKFADNDQKAGLAVYVETIKHANKLELAKQGQPPPATEQGASGFIGLPGINADAI